MIRIGDLNPFIGLLGFTLKVAKRGELDELKKKNEMDTELLWVELCSPRKMLKS